MPVKTIAIIPARSGSKSVLHKNIRPIAGLPMLAWSIRHALQCPEIDRVVVSTDDESYADIARAHGAEVPFLRPATLATDTATDLDVFTHALDWLAQNEDGVPEVVVHLRPTSPLRNADDLSAMIRMLIDNPSADSVRSVVEAPETPYKMWRMRENGTLSPLLDDVEGEAFNMPRQLLPKVYMQNASIDVVRSSVILDGHSMTGKKILGYLLPDNYDIDTELHFMLAQEALSVSEALKSAQGGQNPKTFCIDIDGVVATPVADLDYAKADPIGPAIEAVNRLYDLGHRIVMFTARGTMTGIDWQEETERQFRQWGLKYHELKFGKPAADYYIDDRMLSLVTFLGIGKRMSNEETP